MSTLTEDRKDPPDVVEALRTCATSSPTTAAVEHGGEAVSYEELTVLARQIAAAILQRSTGASPRVLLALPPSTSAYSAMIGSLLAGGSFCPVHLAGPPGRNAAVCHAFGPDVIVYSKTPPPFLDALPVTTPRLDVLQLGSASLATPAVEQSDVAYVIFTSGSTGTPKGVKVGRRAFSYFLHIAHGYFNTALGERWAQFSNLAHDLGVMDVFMTLTQGGTLIPLDEPERLRPATAIKDKRLSVWQSVPSVLELMMRAKQLTTENLRSLRLMSFCGEPLHPHQLDALFQVRPDLHVFNTYGATETTGFNTLNHLVSSNYHESCEAGAVAIGEDVPGWSIHLRGGATADDGEIVVASDYLGIGYWQDENRTRSAFRQVEFSQVGTRRAYFTGDRGIRRGSRLFCSGRLDRQVKIRGERIELDEIDGLLREAGFPAAYTILKDDELYSFVEAAGEVDQERVRAHLMNALPFHAVPKSVHPMPSLPRNPNGKIDREALAREASS